MRENDLQREAMELKSALESAEAQRKRAQDQLRVLEESSRANWRETDEKHVARIAELERVNEELKDKL